MRPTIYSPQALPFLGAAYNSHATSKPDPPIAVEIDVREDRTGRAPADPFSGATYYAVLGEGRSTPELKRPPSPTLGKGTSRTVNRSIFSTVGDTALSAAHSPGSADYCAALCAVSS